MKYISVNEYTPIPVGGYIDYICDNCGQHFDRDDGFHSRFVLMSPNHAVCEDVCRSLCPRCYKLFYQPFQTTLTRMKSIGCKGDVLL